MKLDRKTFASIEEKIHPVAKKQEILEDFTIGPSTDDILIVREIIDFIEKNTLTIYTGTGEWKWLEKNARNKYLEALILKEEKFLSQLYCNMFKNDVTYGSLSPSYNDISSSDKYASVLSKILCDIDTCMEFTDLSSLEIIETNKKLCAPYGVKSKSGYILPDSPRHYYYLYKIKKICRNIKEPTIFEIGGGYGGLANLLYNNNQFKLTYIGIDLLPGLLATYFYLRKCGYKVNLTNNTKNLINGQINLIPYEDFLSDQANAFNIDLIFNSRSLSEFSNETINFYFKFINNSNANFFYHENSNYLLFPKSQRHIEIIGSKFPINTEKYELESMHISPFTGGSGRYREFLYRAY